MTWSDGLGSSCRDHVLDQGPKGATGHDGSDGSSPADRMSRYGKWQSTWGENLSYGMATAKDVLIQLIVDDGVANRGHRTNIFKPGFKVMGASHGPHSYYRTMTCMDYAGGFA